MPITVRNNSRQQIARSIWRDIKNSFDYYYFCIGKTTPWVDENAPPAVLDNDDYMAQVRKGMMFAQRVDAGDIVLLARRIDWVVNTVYDAYDNALSSSLMSYSGATTLRDANFYVINSDNRVYKCIDNNNDSASTFEPTSTGTDMFETDDGYIWKYMFTVSTSDEVKFLNADYIPVRKLTGADSFDVNGELDGVTVTSGGVGYTSTPTVVINGDGDGATASATVDLVSGEVTDITVDNPGEGYSFALVTISGGGASTDATAVAVLGVPDGLPDNIVETTAVDGSIDRIVMVKDSEGNDIIGNNYTAGTIVQIIGDGTGATASVIPNSAGQIERVTVTSTGSGYTYATIRFDLPGRPSEAIDAQARAVISPRGGHGANPTRELFADVLGLNISLADGNNADLILDNDFRQIALIKNVRDFSSSSTLWSEETGTFLHVINVTSGDIANYNEDDVIATSSGGEFVVAQIVEKTDGTGDIYLIPEIPLISVSDTFTNQTTTTDLANINSLTDPEMDRKSGEIFYVENRRNITRSATQVETIKSYISF